jgi:hypothetical protein
MHVDRIKKCETGSAQPTLSAVVKLTQTLRFSVDEMVFDASEREPDEDLQRQFEAISRTSDENTKGITTLCAAMIIKHQTIRWSATGAANGPWHSGTALDGIPTRPSSIAANTG